MKSASQLCDFFYITLGKKGLEGSYNLGHDSEKRKKEKALPLLKTLDLLFRTIECEGAGIILGYRETLGNCLVHGMNEFTR